MGQQQLLLLVIGVVLVGLATVAGLTALQKSFRQDEADGLLERGLAIATIAAGWHSQNSMFGGPNGSYERLAQGGLSMLAIDSTTIRGRYAITAATMNTVEITGVSDRYQEVGIRVYVSGFRVDSSSIRFDGSFSL